MNFEDLGLRADSAWRQGNQAPNSLASYLGSLLLLPGVFLQSYALPLLLLYLDLLKVLRYIIVAVPLSEL